MKLGVQIYGCTKEFRKDPEAFCARMAAAGYTQIEPCISLSMTAEELMVNGMNPVWQPEEVAGFQKMLQRHGLELTSCHIFGDVRKDADKAAALVEKHGVKQVVVNCGFAGTKAEYDAFADGCLYLAQKLQALGAEMWIHNGWPEIRTKIDGKTALEYVLERCGGKVGTQIDTGWVQYGGEDPVVYLEKVAPYLRSIHHKDICAGYETAGDNIHVAMGKGVVDWRGAKAVADAKGLPEVIDQDASRGDFIADLEETAALIKNA